MLGAFINIYVVIYKSIRLIYVVNFYYSRVYNDIRSGFKIYISILKLPEFFKIYFENPQFADVL